ncbi:MAG: hypothetical protein WC977_01860 [Anaerovoracaceae bacterium]|jgi:hypothetical protein
MAEETTAKRGNGAGDPDDLRSLWPNLPGSTKACRTLGISLRKLNQLIADGDIKSWKAPDGTRRFKVAWLEDFAKDREDIPDDDDDIIDDKQASRQGIPAEAIRATAELLKASQKQNLELHELVLKGFKAATEAQDKTIERLQSRNNRYEDIIDQLFKSREEYFDSQLEREMVRESHKSAAERRAQVFEIAKGYSGDLLDILKKKFGVDDATNAKLAAAVELLSGLNPKQIEVAAMMGFFTPAQVALIEKILGHAVQAAPTAETASKEQPAGEGSAPSPAGDTSTTDPPAPVAGDTKGNDP